MDREEEAGADAAEGWASLASSEVGRFTLGSGRPEPEPGLHALTTALARVMDAVPAELVLCTPAGSILHANHPARTRLDADEGRRSLGEEIRFLCVALHLRVAEEAGGEGTGAASQAERWVTLDGSEMHLRAVDLGVSREGRGPTTLVLIASPDDPLSDRRLARLGLTRAEIRIARLVTQEKTNREIAQSLGVSVHTVRHHVQHILDKAGVRSRTQLTKTLHEHGNRTVAP